VLLRVIALANDPIRLQSNQILGSQFGDPLKGMILELGMCCSERSISLLFRDDSQDLTTISKLGSPTNLDLSLKIWHLLKVEAANLLKGCHEGDPQNFFRDLAEIDLFF